MEVLIAKTMIEALANAQRRSFQDLFRETRTNLKRPVPLVGFLTDGLVISDGVYLFTRRQLPGLLRAVSAAEAATVDDRRWLLAAFTEAQLNTDLEMIPVIVMTREERDTLRMPVSFFLSDPSEQN